MLPLTAARSTSREGHGGFRCRPGSGASGLQPGLLGAIQRLGGGGEVAHVQDFIVDVSQVVVDEIGHLGLGLHDSGVGVDEQRAREGYSSSSAVSRWVQRPPWRRAWMRRCLPWHRRSRSSRWRRGCLRRPERARCRLRRTGCLSEARMGFAGVSVIRTLAGVMTASTK